MLIDLIKGFMLICCSLFIHEVAHLFVAKFLRVPVYSVMIGYGNNSIFTIGKTTINPFPFYGHVEVDEEKLLQKSRFSIFIFCYIGGLLNLLIGFLLVLYHFACDFSLAAIIAGSYNLSIGVCNVAIPFNDSDYTTCKELFELKRKVH